MMAAAFREGFGWLELELENGQWRHAAFEWVKYCEREVA